MTSYLRKKNRVVFIANIEASIIKFLLSHAPQCAAWATVLIWALIVFGLVEACGK